LLRHARIEIWSRRHSPLHRRHAAAKILAALAILVSIAVLPNAPAAAVSCLMVLAVAAVVARLPLLSMLGVASVVLPFTLVFAAMSVLAGDPARAVWLVVRAYLSSFTALLLIAATPMPQLIAGLEWLRAPRFLSLVTQFLCRYLLVLMEEAGAMRQAALSRAGSLGAIRFRQSAAAAAGLFVRAHGRARAIHRAMLARGFDGHFPVPAKPPFRPADAGFVCAAAAIAAGLQTVFR
jgi:cobalt/nickel transport system permease protein